MTEWDGKTIDYSLTRRGFMLVAGPDVPTAVRDTGEEVTKMHTTHSDNAFGGKIASTMGDYFCTYPGCKKGFVPTRRWQKFCSSKCKDAYWSEIRRGITQEILRRRAGEIDDNQ